MRVIYIIILSLLSFVLACSEQKNQQPKGIVSRQEVEHLFTNTNPHKVLSFDKSDGDIIKNVIFMIGDGMGANVVQAASISNGGKLYMQNADYTGIQITTAIDDIITDSAAAGTAMSTGEKTKKGRIGVDSIGNVLTNICEYVYEAGKSTGVISSCRIVDATPAAYSVKNINRDLEEDIAVSFINAKIDYIFGGGKDYFVKRSDGKNLLPLLKNKGYQVIENMEELDKTNGGKVFALMANHDLDISNKRGEQLWIGTKKALDILSQNKKGFFLMVESAMIDDYGHRNDLEKMMEETLDFDRTLGKVLEWAANNPGTLVVVTADHSTGGLTLVGGDASTNTIKCHFSSGSHDGVMVNVFSFGVGANHFTGVYENTELFHKLKSLMKI